VRLATSLQLVRELKRNKTTQPQKGWGRKLEPGRLSTELNCLAFIASIDFNQGGQVLSIDIHLHTDTMAVSDYRFVHSTPVLTSLSLRSHPTLSVNSEEPTAPLEFIDKGLALLGGLQRIHDDQLRTQFKEQREFIVDNFKRDQFDHGQRNAEVTEKFTNIKVQLQHFKEEVEQRFEEVGQRFEEVGQRFEEVGQRFEEVGQRFEEVGQRFEEVGQRFDTAEKKMEDFRQEVTQRFEEMNAVMFNRLSYRPHHQIHPVPIYKQGSGLQKPDEDYFPRTIKKFWKMKSRGSG
jgi:hypothetical protein